MVGLGVAWWRRSRRHDEIVRQSEAMLRRVVELVPHMIFARDRAGRFLLANQCVADALETTVDDLIGRHLPTSESVGAARAKIFRDDDDVLGRATAKHVPAHAFVDGKGEQRVVEITRIPFAECSVGDAVLVIAIDVTDRYAAEEEIRAQSATQRLLLDELNHRVRNNLASLMSLIDLSRGSARGIEHFATSMRTHTQAIAMVHSLLSSGRWRGVDITSLIRSLAPSSAPGRLELDGPDLRVPASRTQPLGMVVNELLANSVKHGALGVQGGVVRVEWDAPPTDRDGQRLTITWTETGGPPLEHEPLAGFGTTLVCGLVRSELRGQAVLSYPREGARHRLEIRFAPEIDEAAPLVMETAGV
jgi:PAS domain S-box-containing protein